MVEMAIIMPLLALILFAVIEWGIAFQRWQVLSAASREGARVASLAGCDPATAEAQAEAIVNQFVAAAGIPSGDITVTTTNACGDAGTNATVRVDYAFQFPVLSNMIPAFSDGLALQGASVMRNE